MVWFWYVYQTLTLWYEYSIVWFCSLNWSHYKCFESSSPQHYVTHPSRRLKYYPSTTTTSCNCAETEQAISSKGGLGGFRRDLYSLPYSSGWLHNGSIWLAQVWGEKGVGRLQKEGQYLAQAIASGSTPYHSPPPSVPAPPCSQHCLICSSKCRQCWWQPRSASALYSSTPKIDANETGIPDQVS